MVVVNTFAKQDPASPTFRQRLRIPVGGKSSSELANMCCYAVESTSIDQLLSEGNAVIVHSIYHTSRYIDDMVGFSPVPWERFNYGMGHVATDNSPTEAVLLGMRINTGGDFVHLSLHPKGAGWKWKPLRYIQWNSVNTKYPKTYFMKELAI